AIAPQPLTDLIEARRFDLYREVMQGFKDLQAYIRATSSTIFSLAAQILIERESALGEAAEAAGTAYGLVDLFRGFALHVSRRQLYVPVDLLQRHGVEPDALFAPRSRPGLEAALAELRAETRRQLARLHNYAGTLPEPLIPAMLPLTLIPGYLARME